MAQVGGVPVEIASEEHYTTKPPASRGLSRESVRFLRPFGAGSFSDFVPTPCGVGFILTPLRGCKTCRSLDYLATRFMR